MKYLKKDDTEEIVIKNEVDFNKNGTQVASTKEKVFAKIVESEKNNQYFIKTYNNEIYDPMGLNSNRERFLQTKLRRVSKDTFDFYLIYLQTNNSIYLTRANRRFINE
jgi:predicted aldo/keto reductase-like oxidoreductase|tara:strand:- start:1075 stop:1398 length:324 start_codon:yes stop_codon:yes gene_type:complete